MMTLPSTFERNQWLIDLMSAPEQVDTDGSFDEMIKAFDAHPVEPIIDKINRLENFLLAQPQVEVPVKHYVLDGIYYREITIPRGAFCTGSTYKNAHIHFLIRGDMTVLTQDGLKRVTGAQSFVSPAGVKRAGYAHEETVWAAVFRTDETDPDKAFKGFTIEEQEDVCTE